MGQWQKKSPLRAKEDVYFANALMKLWITSLALSLFLDMFGMRYYKYQGEETNGTRDI